MTPARRAAAVALTTVAADQAVKALVRATIERGEEVELLLGIQLVNVRNRGIAFGLFADGGALLVIFALAALAALLVFFARHRDRPLVWLPTGLLIGGALGNLIDRTRDGAVTDFVDLPLWPAFNLADVAITFGVLTLLYVLEGPPRHGQR
ncbi:MAG TPA: signal peptidase II [Solirubrobacteraceae bacterium]|nr:signal peptidase II [Solirubrobacteraceae bacterium]